MISQMLNDLYTSSDETVDGIVPDGSVGDVLRGVLSLPARAIQLVEYILWDFGS